MRVLILFFCAVYNLLAFSQDDPLRDVYISQKLSAVAEELRLQAAENEYWVFTEDSLAEFDSMNLGDFLKLKMPIYQDGAFERSYFRQANLNSAFGLGDKLSVIVLDDTRISLSDTGLVDFLYNIPLLQVSRIEYIPSMESFRYRTGAVGGVMHIRLKKDSGVMLSFSRSTKGNSNQFSAVFAETMQSDDSKSSFNISLFQRDALRFSDIKDLRGSIDSFTAPANDAVDGDVSQELCMQAPGQNFKNSRCTFQLGSRADFYPHRQGGLLNYNHETVLGKFLVKSSLYLGLFRETAEDAYPRLSFLRPELPYALMNIDGDKKSLYLWRAKTSSDQTKANKKTFTNINTSISYEFGNATDLGLNLSFLYNKYEKFFTSFSDSLTQAFTDRSLSDTLSASSYDSYARRSKSDGTQSKLLIEAFLWKELRELGGGPLSLYAFAGYTYDTLRFSNRNTDNYTGSSYSKGTGDLSSGYLAADIFIPALHYLSLSWSARLESTNFYQRSFIDYKIAKSLFRFSYSTGQSSASIKDLSISTINQEGLVYDDSIFKTNIIRYDTLTNKDLAQDRFSLAELSFHQSLASIIDIDLTLWSRQVDNTIVVAPLDDYLDYAPESAVVSAQDETIYHMSIKPLNMDYVKKKGLDGQLSYIKRFSTSKVSVSENFSFIYEDYAKYKNSGKIDKKGAKDHPVIRENFTISYEAKSFMLAFNEYSVAGTRQSYTNTYTGYTRAYSLMGEYKAEDFSLSVFANDFGAQRLQKDYSEDSTRRVNDSYSLIAGASLGVSLRAEF